MLEGSKNSTSGVCRRLKKVGQIQGVHRENCPDFQVKLLSNRSIYCAYFSRSRVESKSQGRLQGLSTAVTSIREESRPRHLLLHNNGRSTPYQGTGPVELHGPVHSVHCASTSFAPTTMGELLEQALHDLRNIGHPQTRTRGGLRTFFNPGKVLHQAHLRNHE